MQTAVVSIMTDIVKQGLIPPSMASVQLARSCISSSPMKLKFELLSEVYPNCCNSQHKPSSPNFKKVLMFIRVYSNAAPKLVTKPRDRNNETGIELSYRY
jgi:hypothetical protein